MRITAVKGFPVKIGFRNQFIVKIETDAGIDGVGEGGISGHERVMHAMLDHFATFLVGMDPRRIEHIWQTCYRGADFEGGKIVAAALSAIDIALWDIKGTDAARRCQSPRHEVRWGLHLGTERLTTRDQRCRN